MAASRRKPGYDKQQRASLSVPALDSSPVKDCKPTDHRSIGTQAEEIEPLDEKSLEQVVRDCPL